MTLSICSLISFTVVVVAAVVFAMDPSSPNNMDICVFGVVVDTDDDDCIVLLLLLSL